MIDPSFDKQDNPAPTEGQKQGHEYACEHEIEYKKCGLFSSIVILFALSLLAGLCLYTTWEVNHTHKTHYTDALQEITRLNDELRVCTARPDEMLCVHNLEGEAIASPVTVLESTKVPIGIVNNNPLNVKGTGWAGQIGNDDQGHAVFDHPYYGLRAGAKVLKNYQKRHNLKTVEQIIKRWARGDTKGYINFVAKRIDVAPDQEIDVLVLMPWIMEAMVIFECGSQPYPPATFALLGIHADM